MLFNPSVTRQCAWVCRFILATGLAGCAPSREMAVQVSSVQASRTEVQLTVRLKGDTAGPVVVPTRALTNSICWLYCRWSDARVLIDVAGDHSTFAFPVEDWTRLNTDGVITWTIDLRCSTKAVDDEDAEFWFGDQQFCLPAGEHTLSIGLANVGQFMPRLRDRPSGINTFQQVFGAPAWEGDTPVATVFISASNGAARIRNVECRSGTTDRSAPLSSDGVWHAATPRTTGLDR